MGVCPAITCLFWNVIAGARLFLCILGWRCFHEQNSTSLDIIHTSLVETELRWEISTFHMMKRTVYKELKEVLEAFCSMYRGAVSFIQHSVDQQGPTYSTDSLGRMPGHCWQVI